MKKFLEVLLALLIVLAFVACDLAGNTDDGGFVATAPDVGTADELPATGADTEPTDEAAAKSLFFDTMGAIGGEMSSALSDSSRSLSKSESRAVETVTETDEIPVNYTSPDGTIGYSGSIAYTMTMPSDSFVPSANQTYNDIVSMDTSFDLNGTITEATITDIDNTFILNGKSVDKGRMAMNFDVSTDSSANLSSMDLDYSLAESYGIAFSVKKTSGNTSIGAKFILSYSINHSQNNVAIDASNSEFDPSLLLEGAIADETFNLQVYNDNNVLIHEVELSFSELADFAMGGFSEMM